MLIASSDEISKPSFARAILKRETKRLIPRNFVHAVSGHLTTEQFWSAYSATASNLKPKITGHESSECCKLQSPQTRRLYTVVTPAAGKFIFIYSKLSKIEPVIQKRTYMYSNLLKIYLSTSNHKPR